MSEDVEKHEAEADALLTKLAVYSLWGTKIHMLAAVLRERDTRLAAAEEQAKQEREDAEQALHERDMAIGNVNAALDLNEYTKEELARARADLAAARRISEQNAESYRNLQAVLAKACDERAAARRALEEMRRVFDDYYAPDDEWANRVRAEWDALLAPERPK